MRLRLRWIVLACGWWLVACDDGMSAEEVAHEQQQDELDALAGAICTVAEECTCAATSLAGGCAGIESDTWRARLKYGRDHELTYDAECVTAIGDAVGAAECDGAPAGASHPCNAYCAVFHSDRELDQSCNGFDTLVSDCAQGLVCASGRCVEACAVLSGVLAGEQCSDPETGQEFETCAAGLFCSRDTGRCTIPPPAGTPCAQFDECGPSAYCDFDTSACRALPGNGESCWESPDCAEGLACLYSPDYDSATCVPFAEAGEQCWDRPCVEGLSCDADNRCRAPAELGDSCVTVNCVDGLQCDPNVRVCVEFPGVGAECPYGVCSTGAWCDTMTDPAAPVCVAAAADGEACTGHVLCQSGYCPAGFCLARPGEGEDCSELFICAAGLGCDGSTCRASVTAGPAVCVYEGW
jgi:hypothetical protein